MATQAMQIRGIASDVDSGQNAHPKELCGQLSDLTLLHAFEGDLKFETMLKLTHPPDHGEFWRSDKLPKILEVLNLLTTEIPNTWTPIAPEATEKMPCCGGRPNKCFSCSASFARFHQLRSHVQTVHMKRRVQCRKCGKSMYERNLKRHQSICG